MQLSALFVHYPYLLPAFAGLLGLVVGSFLNVVIYRLPIMLERDWKRQCRELLDVAESAEEQAPFGLALPRSRCPHCAHQIRALENIPLLSYVWLRGRCAACRARISPQYPLVELVTGILSALLAWHFGFQAATLAALVLLWAFIALTTIDIEHQLLPDTITLPLLWLGLAVNAFGLFTDLHSAVLGAIAGYLSLWLVFQLFKLATGKEGMGYGDFKLFAAAGAWLGWQMLPLVILVASFVGALVGVGFIILKGRDRRLPIPFGPFLCAATLIALVWGNDLVTAYLRFAGMPA